MSRRWVDTKADKLTSDTGVSVALDGEVVGSCEFATPLYGRVGFRGGSEKKTYLDDVEIYDARAGRVVSESFAVRQGAGQAFAASLLIGVLIVAAVLIVRAGRGERKIRWQIYAYEPNCII